MDENKEKTASPETAEPKFRIGTLEYTKRGLFMLFVYLLWGDFCFTLMESVFPQITPLTMKHLGSNDMLISLVMVTIPNIFNAIVCPWVSFKSDRHRSKLGRRIPFLLYPTPFIALFLIMIGMSPDIGRFLANTILHSTGWGSVAVTLGLIAVFSAGFQYFNMFVGSVYYYLFNDVVPDVYLSRFMAAFRLVGLVAGALFNFVVFRYAETHMKWIFIGAGVLYFVAFMQMSLKVKEGEYPPPPEYVDGKQGVFSGMKTYFKECFSHRFYWLFFLSTAAADLVACIKPFDLLLQRETLGLTPGRIGIILGTAQILTALLILPAGIISDKRHPVRTTLWASIGLAILVPTRLIYLFHHLEPGLAFKVEFALQMILVPLNAIYVVSSLPMYMRILPAERYGQFCSAQAMFRSAANIVFGSMVGGYMMLMKKLSAAHQMYPSYYYGFSPVLTWLLQIVSLIFLYQLYKMWKERGGDESFTPPPVGVSE